MSSAPRLISEFEDDSTNRKHGRSSLKSIVPVKQTSTLVDIELEVMMVLNLEDLSSAQTVSFEMDWHLSEYRSNQFQGRGTPHLGNILTTSGTVDNAILTTSEDYLKTTWPKMGQYVLHYLHHYLHDREFWDPLVQRQMNDAWQDLPDISISLPEVSRGQVVTVVASTKEDIVEIAQVLAWFATAFTSPPDHDNVVYSKPIIKPKPDDDIESKGVVFWVSAALTDMSTLLIEFEACWLPLVNNVVIAYGFPTPARGTLKGLEAPLRLLAELMEAHHLVEFGGYAVLKGFSSMMTPSHKQGDCVQWHLISSHEKGEYLPYRGGLDGCQPKVSLDLLSLQAAASARAIVGWAPNSVQTLGTADSLVEDIDYTQSAVVTSGPMKFTAANLGFSHWATATLNISFGSKMGMAYKNGDRLYPDVIRLANDTPVLLWSHSERRAWLVSASDVILHILRYRHHHGYFKASSREHENLMLDGKASFDISGDVLLQQASTQFSVESESDDMTLKAIVHNIWSITSWLTAITIEHRQQPGRDMWQPGRPRLYGFEFAAVSKDVNAYEHKECIIEKSNGGWLDLVEATNPLVLFVEGAGDVIKPLGVSGNNAICPSYRTLPTMEYYMGTTVSILKGLFDRAGSRKDQKYLSNTHLRWRKGELLFEDCPNIGRGS